MSFKPYTEKIKKKKIGICSILGRIRIHHPGSGSADPDPHQNYTDPKHCSSINLELLKTYHFATIHTYNSNRLI